MPCPSVLNHPTRPEVYPIRAHCGQRRACILSRSRERGGAGRLTRRSSPDSRRDLAWTYRWVTAWLVAGGVLAVLLLANSIRDYRFVWRILAVQQVRQELSRQMVALEQKLRRPSAPAPPTVERLAVALDDVSEPLWIEIRRPDGSVLARRGSPVPGRSRVRTRAPPSATAGTSTGSFPLPAARPWWRPFRSTRPPWSSLRRRGPRHRPRQPRGARWSSSRSPLRSPFGTPPSSGPSAGTSWSTAAGPWLSSRLS